MQTLDVGAILAAIILGPKIVYGHMEKYAIFGMVTCDNKMQPCSLAVSVFWQ
jgi:hypothetical protein